MNYEVKERILDACLEEVLGGQTPPDLTARIMQALDGRPLVSSGNGAVQVAIQAESLASREAISSAVVQVAAAKKLPTGKRTSTKWLNFALAASILAAFLSVGTLVFQLVDRGQKGGQSVATPNNEAKGSAQKNLAERVAKNRSVASPIKDGKLVDRRGIRNGEQNVVRTEMKPHHESDSTFSNPAADAHKPLDAEVIALINGKLQEGWQEFGVVPAGRVDDETWCRRLFELLVGREPTGNELDSFVADPAKNKRELLADRVLADPTYSDELATHFASVWSDLLMGPAGGRRRGDLANRSGLQRYLRESFASNKPLDAMARELISATGSGKPGSADFNGATNFLLAHMDRHGATATAHVGRVFLGQRVKCAQCHGHAAGGQQLAQRDFWQLNSFLRQVDFERGPQADEFALVDRDFDGEGDDPNDAEIYFETPEGRLQVAYPVLDGKAIPTSGYVDEVNRRQELAKLITDSGQFDRALVNHFWKTFFVYELPSASQQDDELIDGLASEFREAGFDARRLVRWIVLSDAFSLPSKSPRSVEVDSPEFGGMALFSRFYQRTVKSEPVTAGLAAAAKAFSNGNVNSDGSVNALIQGQPTNQIIAPELVAPVPEPSMIRLNDREMIRKISAAKELAFNDKVEHLFWSTVTRNPTDRELKLANELYGANHEDSLAALEAIWLVLTNSEEFLSE